MEMSTLDYIKAGLIIIVLIFGLFFALTATNILHCQSVGQTWCNVYWSMVGQPKILVVFGSDGMGNAEKLVSILQDRDVLGVRAQLQNIDFIRTTSYLKNYKMVIVTQARTMSSNQIKMFNEYAGTGILIWTGDAGASPIPGDKKLSDFNIESNDPWTRVTSDNEIIQFGRDTLSAEYIDNYCNYSTCNDYHKDFIGFLKGDPNSLITNGIPPKQEFRGDFSLVTLIDNTSTTLEITLDRDGVNVIGKNPNLKTANGTVFPFMIRSGAGKNVVYLATPIENLIDSKDPNYASTNSGNNLPTTIRKLYQDYFGLAK